MGIAELGDNKIKLLNQVTSKEVIASYRRLAIDDLGIIKEIEAKNQGITDSQNMCVDVSESEFKTYLKPDCGIYYGIFVDEKLVAMYSIIRPIRSENLGVQHGLCEEELQYVAHWELVHVLPEYRGNGLQKFLSQKCSGCLREEWKDVKHIFATIYPYNFASLISTIKYEFVIIGLEEKYGGHKRYILYKPLHGSELYDTKIEVEALLNDMVIQQSYFANGYVGTGMLEKNGVKYIRFNKKIKNNKDNT